MDLAYARVSTTAQDLARQIDALRAAGVVEEYIYVDKRTGANMDREGVVTLLGVWVSDGASRRGGVQVLACTQAAVGWPVTPVTWSQMAKRTVISARCWGAVIRWRWGRKWGEIPLNADRNRCAAPVLRKPFMARSRCLVGWWLFSTRLFSPLWERCSTEGMTSRWAAP
jgi:hypothetical protein